MFLLVQVELIHFDNSKWEDFIIKPKVCLIIFTRILFSCLAC